MTQRLGLFGGSFDPVHNAHLALAASALHELRLDEVLWVPAGQPWQKPRRLSDGAQREAMLRLALAGEPHHAIDSRELRRQGPSYTLDTVRELQAERPGVQIFLLIGQDQYASLHTWAGWPELLQRVVLAVANRPGPLPPVDAAVLRHPHRVVPLAMLDIAATDIRQRVARGERIDHLVPPEVARYIDRQGLYRDAGSPATGDRPGLHAGHGS